MKEPSSGRRVKPALHRRLEAHVAIALALLVAFALGAALAIAQQVVTTNSLNRASSELTAARSAFYLLQDERAQFAAAQASLVTTLPLFRAYLGDSRLLNDVSSMQVLADEYRRQLNAGFCIVTGKSGQWTATSGWPGAEATSPAIVRMITSSAAGQPGRDIVALGDHLFLVVTEPARFAEEILGTLTIGYPIDDALAKQLAQVTHSEVNILVGRRLAASSLTGDARAAFEKLVVGESSASGVAPRIERVGANQYIASTFPLSPQGAGDSNTRLAILQDWTPVQQDLDQLRRRLFAASAVIFLVAFAGGVIFARRVSGPLTAIASAADDIASGNWSRQVPLKGSAEATMTAHAFNEMTSSLRNRTAELEAAKTRAEASERAKDRFLANMSHELRTPLNAIIGFSEVLTDRLFGDLNERQAKYIDNVLVSGRHLLRLINDILDLSKVEAGRVSLEVAPFEPADALRDVHTIVKTLANTKGITLSYDIDPGVPQVTADLQKFKQIMYNLLSNAIKFTRPGGSVKTRARLVTGRGGAGPQLQLSVQDTGIGIKAADHDRIFKEFEQVDSSYGREQQGTGLGLALTRQLVRLHGGRIWLESEEEKGSTFTFVIPVKTEKQANADVAAPVAPNAGRPHTGEPTVLVAEDDPHAAELLEQYITSAGYQVRHAFDGEQAIALARELHPSAITLDIMLPKIDGWSVLAKLKAAPDTKSIPVIIVSITDDRQLGFSLGATDFLLKPVKKEELSDVLRTAVAASRQIRTMLVVDDEPTIVEMVADLLTGHGIQPVKAYNGREAFEMAVRHRPDAIILDLMMPEVTGFDVITRLRDHPEARDIPIVILTAKDLTSDERQWLNRRVRAIASKSGGEALLRELARIDRVRQ